MAPLNIGPDNSASCWKEAKKKSNYIVNDKVKLQITSKNETQELGIDSEPGTENNTSLINLSEDGGDDDWLLRADVVGACGGSTTSVQEWVSGDGNCSSESHDIKVVGKRKMLVNVLDKIIEKSDINDDIIFSTVQCEDSLPQSSIRKIMKYHENSGFLSPLPSESQSSSFSVEKSDPLPVNPSLGNVTFESVLSPPPESDLSPPWPQLASTPAAKQLPVRRLGHVALPQFEPKIELSPPLFVGRCLNTTRPKMSNDFQDTKIAEEPYYLGHLNTTQTLETPLNTTQTLGKACINTTQTIEVNQMNKTQTMETGSNIKHNTSQTTEQVSPGQVKDTEEGNVIHEVMSAGNSRLKVSLSHQDECEDNEQNIFMEESHYESSVGGEIKPLSLADDVNNGFFVHSLSCEETAGQDISEGSNDQNEQYFNQEFCKPRPSKGLDSSCKQSNASQTQFTSMSEISSSSSISITSNSEDQEVVNCDKSKPPNLVLNESSSKSRVKETFVRNSKLTGTYKVVPRQDSRGRNLPGPGVKIRPMLRSVNSDTQVTRSKFSFPKLNSMKPPLSETNKRSTNIRNNVQTPKTTRSLNEVSTNSEKLKSIEMSKVKKPGLKMSSVNVQDLVSQEKDNKFRRTSMVPIFRPQSVKKSSSKKESLTQVRPPSEFLNTNSTNPISQAQAVASQIQPPSLPTPKPVRRLVGGIRPQSSTFTGSGIARFKGRESLAGTRLTHPR